MRVKFLLLFLFGVTLLKAQKLEKDSTIAPLYKNTIRYNLSNTLFFGSEYIIFGYERVLGRHQSASLNFGIASFPALGSVALDSLEVSHQSKGSGFSLALDYRFYLKKENKYGAPHGLYIGPYMNANVLRRDAYLNLAKGGTKVDFELKNELQVFTIGAQIGYQFLFLKDRVALDMILFGPGMGFYKYKGDLNTSLSSENEGKLMAVVKQAILNKFPGANTVFEGTSLESKGSSFQMGAGYRLVFNIGYRF
ncbi:MAG: hypothetical protein CFE21_13290 [Bacteroidetes bacterium B1(2017)]|nr:MAG: hypothetical protein CFE21_13290 [Bacteroidetes bacterium B1(2017)]